MPAFELSIIIPTLNEEEVLPLLLGDLVRQQGLSFEVIIVDGRSTDATTRIADRAFASGLLPGICQVGPRGRGRQLNAGALLAKSEWLLFLHADCRLHDPHQLQSAIAFMRIHQQQIATDTSAGRFAVSFESPDEKSFGLFFYETKAHLGRPGCIHGDQGMLLTRSFFQRVGPFREDLPVMEDTALAEAIRANGQWLLLPGMIMTSARRFQSEGLKARQTLNALMMNFVAVDWLDFFASAPDLYRQQDHTRPLRLLPFFLLIKELFAEMSLRRRWALWLATGKYVQSQAWQIGLALDCRKAYRRGDDLSPHTASWLRWFDCCFNPWTDHFLGHLLTAMLVRFWFAWQLCRNPGNRCR